MKINKLVVYVAIIILSLIPICLFYFNFNRDPYGNFVFTPSQFSAKNSDWGDFGSYLGGIYGAIFSFLSLIFVLKSLRETQLNNIEQIKLLSSEQFTNEFKLLLDNLVIQLRNKKYPKNAWGDDASSFAKNIYIYALDELRTNEIYKKHPVLADPLVVVSNVINQRYYGFFDKEIPLFAAILLRISNSYKVQADAYRAILLANVNNDLRYLMSSHFVHSNFEDLYHLQKSLDISTLPPELSIRMAQLDNAKI